MDETVWKSKDHFGLQYRPTLEDLNPDQLHAFAEAMAGEAVDSFSWQIDLRQQGKKGFYGYKLVPLFTYTTRTGRTGTCRCCVKQISPIESVHYAYLARHGIPVCRVYGVIPLTGDMEIIALEYLDRIGAEALDDERRAWLLRIKAQINALPVDSAYRAQLDELAKARVSQERTDRDAYYDRLFGLAVCGNLGYAFRDLVDCCPDARASLQALAADVDTQVAALPQVLSNQELDVGYRPGSNDPLCFDLHSTRLAPRFSDLRQIIGLPDGVVDGWGESWHPRERWVRVYLSAYNAVADAPVSEDDVYAGARLLWLHHALDPDWSNWFLDRALDGEEGTRDNLLSVTSYLMSIRRL